MTLRRAQFRAALVGLPFVLAVLLTGCAGTPAGSAASTSGTGSSSSSTHPTGTASTGAEKRIEVTFAHGKASGNTGRIQVALGTPVALVVTSDTADEVHVHGYDIERELTPGTPATLRFDATVAGVFEVELHKAGTVLLRLQVS